MKSYSFTTDIDTEEAREPRTKRLTNNSNEAISAYGFSGPYFQPDAVEIKELARDLHIALIDGYVLAPDCDPPVYNHIREEITKFLAKQFRVNLERSPG